MGESLIQRLRQAGRIGLDTAERGILLLSDFVEGGPDVTGI